MSCGVTARVTFPTAPSIRLRKTFRRAKRRRAGGVEVAAELGPGQASPREVRIGLGHDVPHLEGAVELVERRRPEPPVGRGAEGDLVGGAEEGAEAGVEAGPRLGALPRGRSGPRRGDRAGGRAPKVCWA